MEMTKEENDIMHEQFLQKLVLILQQGGVVSFPTETVYALAGDARNPSTIKRIFKLKARPLNQPLSVLLPRNGDLSTWVKNVPPIARQLAENFWPGPITLIFNKNESVLSELTGGGTKIGLRVPNHFFAQRLLQAFDGGLAAPSANVSGQLSPTQHLHVRQAFADKLDAIVDGGACSIGMESTIVDVSSDIPQILRLGAISLEAIQNVIHTELIINASAHGCIRLPVKQVQRSALKTVVHQYLNQGKSIAVLARYTPRINHPNLIWMAMPAAASDYARVLYQRLHEVENNSTEQVLIESLPMSDAWAAIRALLGI